MKNVFTLALFFVFYTGIAQSDIFDIARNGTLAELISLIDSNEDTINSINKRGDSPLVLATYYGNNEVALYLAEHTKDINIQSKNGTPLIAAVYTGNKILAEGLLKHGADTEGKDSAGKTAIMYALISKDIELINLLLLYKANTNVKDKNNYAVIDYAKQTSDEEIINLIRNN
ncbi:MAG: ankyrin repeat domain-containing protein [Urechidicola sp.]|nr:ankyrin repeat domain-containing protein [Urechidicola sp.]